MLKIKILCCGLLLLLASCLSQQEMDQHVRASAKKQNVCKTGTDSVTLVGERQNSIYGAVVWCKDGHIAVFDCRHEHCNVVYKSKQTCD